MGNVREHGAFGSYEPFWGEFHIYRGVGRALVIDETLILVAGVIRVFVLATGAGDAWCACTRVAIGNEEESSRACGWGMCRGRWRSGWERAHCRLSSAVVAGACHTTGLAVTTNMSRDLSHISEPDVPYPYLFFFIYNVFFFERGEKKEQSRGSW
jgi:hypothetical protein